MWSGWQVTNRRGQLVRRLKNGKSSVVSGQRLLPGPSLSADLPCWRLAATRLSWGPARHLHVPLWPSSRWVITLSTALTTPQRWWGETRWGGQTWFPEMTCFGCWNNHEEMLRNHFTACLWAWMYSILVRNSSLWMWEKKMSTQTNSIYTCVLKNVQIEWIISVKLQLRDR